MQTVKEPMLSIFIQTTLDIFNGYAEYNKNFLFQ